MRKYVPTLLPQCNRIIKAITTNNNKTRSTYYLDSYSYHHVVATLPLLCHQRNIINQADYNVVTTPILWKKFDIQYNFGYFILIINTKISSLGTQYCPVCMLRRTCISCTWAFFCYYCIMIILQKEYNSQYWLIYMLQRTCISFGWAVCYYTKVLFYISMTTKS